MNAGSGMSYPLIETAEGPEITEKAAPLCPP